MLTADADLTDIAELNPFRYRGYYYDTESSLYYLNSRYYDPETGRFVSQDSYISTGQGFAGFNMFAYCNDNPVNYADYSGNSPVSLPMLPIDYLSLASLLGSAAVAGPAVLLGGAILAAGYIYVNDAVVSYNDYQETKSIAPENAISDSIALEDDENPVIFPEIPDMFNPVGLVKVHRPGTKNGAFVSWMDPITNTEVFRWDENTNFSNGPHYHIYGTGHYKPGTIVPEPFATIYFPFR